MTALESTLTAFAANVASNLVQSAGSKLGEKLKQPEIEQSIQRCLKISTAAMLTRSTIPSAENHHKLMDCFLDAFDNRSVTLEFSKIFRGKEPDIDQLAYLFEEEAGWNIENLPGLAFEDGMEAFIAAFMESALKEPRLNDVIRAEHLIRHTKLQESLLSEMRQLAAFFREKADQVIGINADRIEAKNVANEIVIYQASQSDLQTKRAETEEQHYLKTLIRVCDTLDIAAIDEMCGAESSVRISDVFTKLYLAGVDRLPDERVKDAIYQGGAGRREMESAKEKEPIPIQAIEAIGSLPRLVVLGQPGGGKSTLVNYITTQLALRRINDSSPAPLAGWEGDNAPLPVRIMLRHLAANMPPTPDQDGAGMVWDHIRDQLEKTGCGGFYEPLRHILQEEGGVVFFDGLDEVMQTEEDPRRTRIKNAVEAFSGPLDKCRTIVTSREYAYNKSDEWRLMADQFPVVTLDAFKKEQIETFIETWYRVIGPKKGLGEKEIKNQADHLSQAVQSLPHLQELAQYPLLLTLMAQVHINIGYLPENRSDLYDRAVNLLLAHWDNRLVRDAGGARTVEKGLIMRLNIRLETLRASLERVAFSAHEKQEKTENRTSGCADIPMSDLLFELEKDLKSLDSAKTVVEYIHERAGLLAAQEEYRVYSFPHRTFQEYLTACHIMKKSDFNSLLKERVRRDLVWWREVYLLAAGLSRKFPLYVSNLATTLVPQGPKESDTGMVPDQKSQHAILAGNALVETEFSKYVEKEKEDEPGIYSTTLERIQNWLLASIASTNTINAKSRAEAGQTLSRLGDPRPEVLTLENMEFCLISDSPFQMGDGEENHPNDCLGYDFWVSKHPVTNAQYALFVDTGGYEETRYWVEAEAAGCWKSGKFKGKYEKEFRRGPERYRPPFHLENHPAVGISWYEALAFTRWLTDIWQEHDIIDHNWRIRLPSEAEWEKAARGGLKIPKSPIVSAAAEKVWESRVTLVENETPERVYPWGDKIDKERVNYSDTGIGTTCALGCFCSGASPYGCLDMAGNVWEWTRSLEKKYPYDPSDDRENEEDDGARVLRGGAFDYTAVSVRCADRYSYNPHFRLTFIGFRCVCAPNTSVL